MKVSVEYMECLHMCNLVVLYKFTTVHYNLLNIFRWLSQISSAGDYLHRLSSFSITHSDIKPSNIFVFKKGKLVKLGDFGSARNSLYVSNSQFGTVCYMAPELLSVKYGKFLGL